MSDNLDNHRPWGFYEILSERRDHKVKRITVYSGKRCSLQRHKRRAEHWYILKGRGSVVCGDEIIEACAGDSIDIKAGDIHRIENRGADELVFIEVQSGDYFGEDDIERIEDDFGRI